MIDLHVHTSCSDGSTAPKELVHEASRLGMEALAIADHDTLAGYDRAAATAIDEGLELVCAVELSTRPATKSESRRRELSVHLLGYFLLSPPTAEFREWLEIQQQSRRQRNLTLVAKLRGFGMEITLGDAELYGRNQVGRPHFAKVMLDKGYVSSLQQAFDLYLADDAKAAVEREEPTLEEGIQRICSGGGIASLAHPVRLPRQGEQLASLLEALVEVGLAGIEVYHSEHSAADSAAYMELARRFDLIPTGGSDYHGENKPGVRLGTGIDGNVNLTYEFLEHLRELCCAKR